MKNTLKKLPFVLAFVVTLLAASCSDEMVVEPVHTDGDGGAVPLPPPPSGGGTNSVAADTVSIG